jgi:hypothetical protein
LEKEVLILESCPHTLISPGRLASEQGIGFWVGGYQDECYLRPTPGTPADDIMLVNMGITILPDAEAAAFQTGVVRGINSTTNGFSPTTVHKTLNHRGARSLQHLPDCTADAPEAWHKFDSGPCDDCLCANCDKVHSKRQAAKRGNVDGNLLDGHLVSERSARARRPDQRARVPPQRSKLNKFYLLMSGHESETTKATRRWFNWARNHGRTFTHAHTDNAPNLCMGTTKQYIEEEEKSVLTTSAAREARGNSTIERAWRSAARDTRAALVVANLTNFLVARDERLADEGLGHFRQGGQDKLPVEGVHAWDLAALHRPPLVRVRGLRQGVGPQVQSRDAR